MRICELIEYLSRFDPNAPVIVRVDNKIFDDSGRWYTLSESVPLRVVIELPKGRRVEVGVSPTFTLEPHQTSIV